jgi:linoleoyl-CoA desaturase
MTNTANSHTFSDVLFRRAEQYFNTRRGTRYANAVFYSKAVLLLLLYGFAYYIFVFTGLSFSQLILVAFLLGFCHVFIPVNIGHDSIHGALSKSRLINSIGLLAFEITGSNSYMYKIKHLEAHYNKENGSKTIAIESQGLLLQKENTQGKTNLPVYFYLLYAQYMIFIRDFVLFFSSGQRIPVLQKIRLVFSKIIYLIAFPVLPFIFSPNNPGEMIIGLLVMYLFVTIFLVVILLMPTEKLGQTRGGENGYNDKWLIEILEHNVDFSPGNVPLNLLAGGSNLNVVHYFFPSVNHVHYNKLASIIESTANEFGYRYRKQQVADVFGIHLKYLKNIQAGK